MAGKALAMANRKEVRYLIVGGWNTVFGWAVFVLLQLTVGATIGYMAVLVIAQIISIINAYLCYRWFVFKVQGSWWLDFFRFSTVYWIVFAINLVALPLMVSGLGMNVIVAQTLFLVVTVVASYIAHNRFSFRRPGPPAA
jgi:putative flippase GtrA